MKFDMVPWRPVVGQQCPFCLGTIEEDEIHGEQRISGQSLEIVCTVVGDFYATIAASVVFKGIA